jgi:hypothetical protein
MDFQEMHNQARFLETLGDFEDEAWCGFTKNDMILLQDGVQYEVGKQALINIKDLWSTNVHHLQGTNYIDITYLLG